MTATTPPDMDPRTGAAAETSVLPVVARPRSGPPAWVLVLIAVSIGTILFVFLDARRLALTAPAVHPRSSEALSAPSDIAPLYVPPVPPPPAPVQPQPLPTPAPAAPPPEPNPPASIPTYPIQPSYPPQAPVVVQPPARVAGEPMLVIDSTTASSQAPGDAGAPAPGAANAPSNSGGSRTAVIGTRTGAGMLANKATTVPQGTLIPAVLETALDSTRPGLARALVSRDIRGFDGSRVLIPRGSRLIGEYGSDIESGQKRMLVNWTRLTRPDGVTIAINSPASDPMGQGGIRASVNSHFFERFAGAILQSALDVGVNLASRAADSQVIVALPGTLSNATRSPVSNNIKPTLKVKAAKSISIFVARDLDFTGVESR